MRMVSGRCAYRINGWPKRRRCRRRGGIRLILRMTPGCARMPGAAPVRLLLRIFFLRARFEVTDPALVRELKLLVGYHGGVIVSVNGRELGRGNVAKDAAGPDRLAEAYLASAFVN